MGIEVSIVLQLFFNVWNIATLKNTAFFIEDFRKTQKVSYLPTQNDVFLVVV